MTGEQLKVILERLQVLKINQLIVDELLGFGSHYSHDIPILLTEIERLNKLIDSMKEENK